ncbi:MAG: thioesterase [Rickettsiales bacterium]|nr:thioesterase [Rickettsiales bacterium]|tara:strand:+ start:225 stop:662 length:438 start_codon:yes stop_codon:yes gene_type:complete
MNKVEHYKKLENIYYKAEFNMILKPIITISEARCEIKSIYSEIVHHAADAAHGSMIFKTLDDSAYFAANSLEFDEFLVTVSYNMHFVRPIFNDEIISIGTVKEQNRHHIIAESKSVNKEGKTVAFGIGTFTKSNVKLETLKHYKL